MFSYYYSVVWFLSVTKDVVSARLQHLMLVLLILLVGAGDAGAVLNKADGAKPTERRSAFGRLSLKSASDRRNSKSTGSERKSSIGTRPDCADELPNHISYIIRLPCFDAVGWAAGRASGL